MRIPFAIPDAAGRPFDVVALGQNSVDYVAVLSEYPAPNAKYRLDRFARLPGGQAATAVAACRRLGWRSRYVGVFGDDEAGRLSRESLAQAGIDVSGNRTVAGAGNRLAVILVDSRSGERTILWHRDRAMQMDPREVPAAVVTSGRLLLVDCEHIGAATAAATAARQAGIPTIVDVEDVQPETDALLRQITAIICAREFPSTLTGEQNPGRALEVIEREYAAPVVCVTLGAEGSLARCAGREIRTAAFAVECVDTTGAGDVFRGAFAAASLRRPHGELEDVLAYANAAAALSCRALGAQGALPSSTEVERLLRM
jgi:sulfofructose kinase